MRASHGVGAARATGTQLRMPVTLLTVHLCNGLHLRTQVCKRPGSRVQARLHTTTRVAEVQDIVTGADEAGIVGQHRWQALHCKVPSQLLVQCCQSETNALIDTQGCKQLGRDAKAGAADTHHH